MTLDSDNKAKRSQSRLHLLPLAIFIILMIVFFIGLGLNPRQIPSPLIDQPVPEFSLPKLKQPTKPFSQTDLQGQVSLLNVWASWCRACRQEHEVLMQIAESKHVAIYGLFYKDNRENGLNWLQKLGDPYQFNGVDSDGRAGIEWGVYGTPETFVIDQQGLIRYKHIGPISWDDWQNVLLPLVKKLKAANHG